MIMPLNAIVTQTPLTGHPAPAASYTPRHRPVVLHDRMGVGESGPTALIETHDVFWAIDTLEKGGWLSRVPRLDTRAGVAPWNSSGALAFLRSRQAYSVRTLLGLNRTIYGARTDPSLVGRRYADIGPNVPVVRMFDRKGKLVAYATKRDHWVFVALPSVFSESPKH